ncbi:ankyrin repeat domain-containing protein [Burkholderia ubonensis]|uniref:ankyrin repeat domain-containing protein n=1 Tax=Burkholderia ubonensis TaxID=101571 RepID=UPI001E58385A|nr:ankyrin repeat domain-containing protein [Burkholderia ubonensis]
MRRIGVARSGARRTRAFSPVSFNARIVFALVRRASDAPRPEQSASRFPNCTDNGGPARALRTKKNLRTWMIERNKRIATVLARGLACLCAGLAFSGASYALEGKEWDLMAAMGDYAVKKTPQNMARVKALLKRGARPYNKTATQPSAMPDEELTPMGLAVVSGVPDVVGLFLASGVAVNMPMSPDGPTLLTYTIGNLSLGEAKPEQIETVRLLIDAGADVNVIAPNGETPLETAASAYTPSLELVRMLLKAGANPRAADPSGRTILFGRAASDLAMLKTLVDGGADPYAHSNSGASPLTFVCERRYELNGQPDPTAAERIAILHKPGTPVEPPRPARPAKSVPTPLLYAAMAHNPDCVKALLEAGANPDAPAMSGDVDGSDYAGSVREVVARKAKSAPDLVDAAAAALIERAPRQ